MEIVLDPLAFPCDGAWLGIPHFWNVVTNLPFVALGIVGLRRTGALASADVHGGAGWRAFWWSTLLLGLASGTYHVEPTRATLAFDRVFVSAMAATPRAAPGSRCSPALRSRRCPSSRGGSAHRPSGTDRRRRSWVSTCSSPTWPWRAGGGAPRGWRPSGGWSASTPPRRSWRSRIAPSAISRGCIGGHPFKHLFAAAGVAWLLAFVPREVAALASRDEAPA